MGRKSKSSTRPNAERRSKHVDMNIRVGVKTEDDLFDIIGGLGAPALILILDTVQDPHNLGASLRTADAAGAHAVVAPKDRSVGVTDTVRRIASGAAENIPFVQVTNLARTLDNLKEAGLWIVGTADTSEKSIYEMDLTGPVAIVMGSEGTGLRRLTAEHCDFMANIPMSG